MCTPGLWQRRWTHRPRSGLLLIVPAQELRGAAPALAACSCLLLCVIVAVRRARRPPKLLMQVVDRGRTRTPKAVGTSERAWQLGTGGEAEDALRAQGL